MTLPAGRLSHPAVRALVTAVTGVDLRHWEKHASASSG